ncbi:urease accessory protein UreD [Lichenihabitans sp. Uapishka_5]|uniref:urease accessory protein UreD n=1 Tax=Lichenihabitans sp. Uapishka_5 TaxID=3037302 RepID=UPI0029E7F73A|nr:urease accessory protein UreD [Lichenihabitans sp. Uapishka_5]MDX7950796.1 urease accessory protein UreD [Lichenihabitans sp. Uapishka_5]
MNERAAAALLPSAKPGTRAVDATLRFARGGGRTFLARQAIPYPFHITRPHHLDLGQPDLATLYLQSASGGLYGGDRLTLAIAAGPEARAHVTSQAATVVHTGRDIRVETHIDVAAGAWLALTTDPYILFPGTDLSVSTNVTLAPGATAILAEGFSPHDPAARGAPFAHLSTATRIDAAGGGVLVDEQSHIDGPAFAAPSSPLGSYGAMGMVFILGDAAQALDAGGLEAALDAIDVLAGASRLPGGAGWGVRLLARDGGRLSRGVDLVFTAGFTLLVGCAPARRRK